MALYDKYLKFNLSKVIAVVLIALTVLSTKLFFSISDPQYSSLVSGLATGFALATIQFFFSWYEYAKIDKYQKMSIIDIRKDRDDRELYGSLISDAKEQIIVLGSTASRLLSDFANTASNQAKNKYLLTALSKGVRVRVLLPDKHYLEQGQQAQFDNTKNQFQALQAQYSNFEYKYFQHSPSHSIFLVDDECILGPMFPGISSRNTPSIHVKSSSPFSRTYLEYFENEWR
ncbi:hypothetical protein [Pedobacter frigidisoli]|uniref:hypothetical protein n=1 Tax=Pedobacter frigidisoli TaxID=2530455 RepID=UPI00292FF85B|nr:hypothetical protein [Pedobacter frigidisoli]